LHLFFADWHINRLFCCRNLNRKLTSPESKSSPPVRFVAWDDGSKPISRHPQMIQQSPYTMIRWKTANLSAKTLNHTCSVVQLRCKSTWQTGGEAQ
jgi:hypothetical protein